MANHNDPHRRTVKTVSSKVNRRAFLGAAGAAGLTGLAGCANLTGGGGGDEGPIVIGAQYLLSGLAESLGAASRAAAELAVKQVNEEGGIMGREVELIVRDHENSADNANQNFRDLVQNEGAAAMIGLTSSGVTLSTGPTVAELGIPFVLTDIGTPFITEHDEETYGENAQGQPNIFRTNSQISINTYGMAKHAYEKFDGVERVANLGPDYAYGWQAWEYFKAFSDSLGAGYEYVESQFPEVGASDMTPQINTVNSADPDLVFTSFWAGDVVTFVLQGIEQGLFDTADYIMDTLGADPTIFEALGNQMPEDIPFGAWYWHSAHDNPQNQEFVSAWRDEYVDTDVVGIPSIAGPSTWSAIWMLKEAMESTESTAPEDIIGALKGMEFDSPEGRIRIDPDSHQTRPPVVVGRTSPEDDVPYDGLGLVDNDVIHPPERAEMAQMLADAGTDLPPGI